MPEELERKLQREAAEKFPDDPERQRRYVYGTLRHTGWTPHPSKTPGVTGRLTTKSPRPPLSKTQEFPNPIQPRRATRRGYEQVSDAELLRRLERGRAKAGRKRATFRD